MPSCGEYVDRHLRLPLLRAPAWRLPELDETALESWAGTTKTPDLLPVPILVCNLGLVGVVTAATSWLVLAHELSHVTQRHYCSAHGAPEPADPCLSGLLDPGVLAASKSNSADSTQAANAAVIVAGTGVQSQFTARHDARPIAWGLLRPRRPATLCGFVSMFGNTQASRLQ